MTCDCELDKPCAFHGAENNRMMMIERGMLLQYLWRIGRVGGDLTIDLHQLAAGKHLARFAGGLCELHPIQPPTSAAGFVVLEGRPTFVCDEHRHAYYSGAPLSSKGLL